jgi:hypothetical protein
MSTVQLTSLVGLILALSIASERLVEIVKGVWPWVNKPKPEDDIAEGRRRTVLQLMAVVAGIATAFLARSAIPVGILPADATGVLPIVALGLLASGGSGFWNAILGYMLQVKDLKKVEAEDKRVAFADRMALRR